MYEWENKVNALRRDETESQVVSKEKVVLYLKAKKKSLWDDFL